MKAHVSRGAGFLGALLYVLDEGPNASGRKKSELIYTSLPGTDAKTFSAAFGAFRRLRPDIRRPVWHSSLRLPAGERLSSEAWSEVAASFLKKMGFNDSTPHVVVRHCDVADGDHVHIVLGRVDASGKVWLGQHEVPCAIAATQEIEREFGLKLTAGLGDANAEEKTKRPPRIADSQKVINANRVKGQRRVDTSENARVLRDCASRSHDLPSFIRIAAVAGYSIEPNRSKTTGYVSGLSVLVPGRKKHLALGDATNKALTWPKLLKIFQQNDDAADAARRAGRDVVASADRRAADVVDTRLRQQADNGPDDESKSEPTAILPSLVTKEAQSMARHLVDPNDQLGFLSEPSPPRPAGRLDDAALHEDDDARLDRERRNAELALAAELKGASKTQLSLARQSLRSELTVADADAIARFVTRLTRLVLRIVTAGTVVLPPSEAERRAFVARQTIEQIDGELRQRAEIAAAVCEVQAVKKSTSAREPVEAVSKLQVLRTHDPRQLAPAQRDRDEIARQLDAERERNRS